jgi:hypothetical protein
VCGSSIGMWLLFLLRDQEKGKEMAGTQHI